MATITTALKSSEQQPRRRLRDVVPGVYLGTWPPGPKNSLTDVRGVLVDTTTLRSDDGAVNTGCTTILPRKDWFNTACHAGVFRFNGSGEMTGSHWIEETGLLASPIVITNSFSVGEAYRGIYDHAIELYGQGGADWFLLPVVAETWDGWMNDLTRFAVTPAHIVEGIRNASDAAVPEGCVGGGTGMLCQGFKGGTGSSSRVVPGVDSYSDVEGGKPTPRKTAWTVAALVQANYGRMQHLHVAGVPVGRIMAEEKAQEAKTAEEQAAADEAEASKDRKDGSIIVILATDAPLHPVQLQRLAKRATVGLARVGGYGHNASGDIFLAFSTGNSPRVQTVGMDKRAVDPFGADAAAFASVDDNTINALLEAAADATQEAIYNALCMAETMVGFKGHRSEAIDLGRLAEIMEKYGVKEGAQ